MRKSEQKRSARVRRYNLNLTSDFRGEKYGLFVPYLDLHSGGRLVARIDVQH